MNKIIENIGLLDVREADENVLSQIDTIRQVGTYITNDTVEAKMMHINKKSVGNVVKVDGPIDRIMINGKDHISSSTLEGVGGLVITINGKCFLDPDLDVVAFKEKIISGSINGKLYLPSKLSSVKSKFMINGVVVEYDDDVSLVEGKVVMNDAYLDTYFGDRKVAFEKLVAVEPLNIDLIEEELEKIQVISKLVITKSNAKMMKHLLKVDQKHVTIIPEKVHYVDEDVYLDEALIKAANQQSLYIEGKLSIDDVKMLSLLGEGKIYAKVIKCEESDADMIKAYCANKNQKFKFKNKGGGFSNYNSFQLDKNYLESLTSPSKFENYGTLNVADDVLTAELKVDFSISNYGVIAMNPDVKTWIVERLNDNFGNLEVQGEKVEEENSDVLFSNMGYLKL